MRTQAFLAPTLDTHCQFQSTSPGVSAFEERVADYAIKKGILGFEQMGTEQEVMEQQYSQNQVA